MNQELKASNDNKGDEISAKELIVKIEVWIKYLLSKWLVICGCILFGCVIGFVKFAKSKYTYTADCTFTLDEGNSSKPGAGGGLALLGISGTSEGGLFQGKNLIWLYTSRQMLEKALLSRVVKDGKEELYIDWFFSIDEEAKKTKGIDKVKFPTYKDSLELSLDQNNFLSFAISRIKGQYLSVDETKNTENFITVTIKSSDEQFAKQFSDIIVKTVNDFYIETKTQKLRKEIDILERKTEGYQGEMNSSMYQTASAIDATPYPNPNQQVLQVNAEKKGVGVKINSELYIQMVKLLEQNRMDLAKETPLIQVIEEPVLPLPASKLSLFTAIIYSIFISGFLSILMLTVVKTYKSIRNS